MHSFTNHVVDDVDINNLNGHYTNSGGDDDCSSTCDVNGVLFILVVLSICADHCDADIATDSNAHIVNAR